MIIKIIMILLILSPFCNGLTYLFVSKHPITPYCNVAKYKDINDDYTYKNHEAGIVYIILGGIIGCFFLLICFLYNFFDGINVALRIFGFYIIISLIETVLFDTILNMKFELKNYEENSKNKE